MNGSQPDQAAGRILVADSDLALGASRPRVLRTRGRIEVTHEAEPLAVLFRLEGEQVNAIPDQRSAVSAPAPR